MTIKRYKRDTSGLCPREWEVMLFSAIGLNDKEIARKLGTSEKTVRDQRCAVKRKTGHKNFVTLAVEAYSQGLTEFRDGKLCIALKSAEKAA